QIAHAKPVKVDEKHGVEVLPRRSAAAVAAAAAAAAKDAKEAKDETTAPGKAAELAGATTSKSGKVRAPVDKAEVAKLITRLSGRDGEKAREELVRITRQDFGNKAKRWE